MLKKYIEKTLQSKKILLMTHIVIGYPNLEQSYEIIKTMVDNGVDLIELQIPFSEPIADGPVILKANQVALQSGITVNHCFQFANQITSDFNIPFLFMSYYNILFKYGIPEFTQKMQEIGIQGSIIPDLPPEESAQYEEEMVKKDLHPIYLFTPYSSAKRMKYCASLSKGFVYCVARKGVTGKNTKFDHSIADYLKDCKKNTDLPLAVGFGVKNKNDIDFLSGKAEIAIIGSQMIKEYNQKGITGIKSFLQSLKSD
ncbi:MAG: tryptophan synthase subunit alpha [Spirochaetes bacterium]|nr:tryptophan synthase subunit alpha [Spirochaetota bacterium]